MPLNRCLQRVHDLAAHAGPSTWQTYLSTASRSFASSAHRSAQPVGHYDALKLPKNATKQQVKARFYELSKKHHPDTPGGSAAKFHEINDAYAILGDESKRYVQLDLSAAAEASNGHLIPQGASSQNRRQYDQSLAPSRPTTSSGSSFHPHSPHLRRSSGPHSSWGRSPPRSSSPGGPTAGAGGHYNPFGRRAPPNYNTGPGPSYPGAGSAAGAGGTFNAYARAAPDPFGRTHAGQRKRGAAGGQGDEENANDSGLGRFAVVVLLMMAIVGFGGGLTASADDGEDASAQIGVHEELD